MALAITQSDILTNPVLLVALASLIVLGVHYQRGLSYREYITAHRVKCLVFQVLDPLARKRGRPLVHTKGYNDGEHVRTPSMSPREVAEKIRPEFSPHLIASAKRRNLPDGSFEFAHSQWVQLYEHDGREFQTEVFLFPSKRSPGGTDVYVHVEPAVTSPRAHLSGEQYDGDVHDRFVDAWTSGD